MLSVKTRPKPGSTSFAARSLSEVGLAVGRMSNVMLPTLSGAGVIFRAALSEIAMAFSRILSRLGPATARGAVYSFWTGPAPGFLGGPDRQDMLLPNAEVQYVCRCAARQSHGHSMRGCCRSHALSSRFETSPRTERSNISSWSIVL